MKKMFFLGLLVLFCSFSLFAQVTDEQIRQAANILGVPYDDLRQFVQSYQNNTSTDVILINAVTLYQEYQSNAVRADSQYKGKSLKITGIVTRIDTDRVGLRGSSTMNVYINFRSSELSKIANLQIGQTVTFIGIGDGIPGGLPRIIDAVLVTN
jgi:hypothetical protein